MSAPPRAIIGQSFSDYVINQINIRQNKLSLDEKRNDQVLKYINNKTSFVRLLSSIDINRDDPDWENSAAYQNLKGISGADDNTLAKKHVLEGARVYTQYDIIEDPGTGTKSFTTEAKPLGGVGYTQSEYPLYGWLASTNSGLIPPPGITSVEVKSLNRGSLREATINIVCHNLQQFKVIDALYLRLKYTMLLEWGHTLYFDNSGTLMLNGVSRVSNYFLNNSSYKADPLTFLDSIEETRRAASGNYDAMLGQVKNFEWTLREDGGYDITIQLISVGDVIESLKVNTNYPGLSSTAAPPYPQPSTGEEPPVLPSAIANKNKSTLNQILYALQQVVINEANIRISPANSSSEIAFIKDPIDESFINSCAKYYSEFSLIDSYYLDSSDKSLFSSKELMSIGFESLSVDTEGDPESGELFYIKLGALLRIIQSYLLKYNSIEVKYSVNDGFGKCPLVYIDTNYDTNLCLTLEDQFSTDPRVCILKPQRNLGSAIDGYFSEIDDSFRVSGNSFLGKFMHIYVNLNFISSTLENSIDSEGKASIYDFLTGLMKGIQSATGCINDYEVTYEDNTSYLIIRDNNVPSKAAGSRYKSTAKFNTHLLTNTAGCFVLDTQLKTELNNKFASIISIGAQANGNQVGENATMLSKLNTGYVDRIVPSRTSAKDEEMQSKITSTSNGSGVDAVYNTELQNNIFYLLDYIDQGVVTTDNISNGTQAIVDYYKAKLGESTDKNQISGVGFIPLSLQLKMDGLSGMKIYEVYTTDDAVLPPLYKNKIQFIIKGITHRIDPTSGWVTTIESLAGPRDNDKTSYKQPSAPSRTGNIYVPPEVGNGGLQQPGGNVTPIDDSIINPTSLLRTTMARKALSYYNANIREIQQDRGWYNLDFENRMLQTGWKQGHQWCNYFCTLIFIESYREVSQTTSTDAADIAYAAQINDVKNQIFNNFPQTLIEDTNYHTGSKRNVPRLKHGEPTRGYCPSTYNRFRDLRHGVRNEYSKSRTKDVTMVYPGDCVMFDWESSGTLAQSTTAEISTNIRVDHIAMVVAFDTTTRMMSLVHGNYGARVYFEKRKLDSTQIWGIIRPIENVNDTR